MEAAEAQVRAILGRPGARGGSSRGRSRRSTTRSPCCEPGWRPCGARRRRLDRARADLARAQALFSRNAIPREELDQRREAERVAEALASRPWRRSTRRGSPSAFPRDPRRESCPTSPPTSTRPSPASARRWPSWCTESAQVGLPLVSVEPGRPKQALDEFISRDKEGNIDRILERHRARVAGRPAGRGQAPPGQRDLAQAELNLRYCDIVSEIDGVVTSRNVNPGNNVAVGQSLMAVRSLTEIWIDANFKETQLADLRIGQRVRCEVDMYGGRREFEGRITGFTMGTGQTLALLPPQNATGNFVKIVQRLPVRIELTDYDPDKAPLFVGLSVVPYVYYKEPPTGPHAGEVLQPHCTAPAGPTSPDARGDLADEAADCQGAWSQQTVASTRPTNRHASTTDSGRRSHRMSSVALPATAVSRPAINPWLVAVAVVIPTFMEVLDTTIANVSLRYIAGGLSATMNDSEWVHDQLPGGQRHHPADHRLALGPPGPPQLLPPLHRRLHRRLGAVRPGHQPRATDPVPGDPGPGRRRAPALQPGRSCSTRFPPEKQGTAMTMFGVAGLTRPGRRPDAGRLLTVNYNWRWIFLINLPIGVLGFLVCLLRWSRTPITSRRSGRSCAAGRSTSTTSAWGCSP